MAGNNSIVTIIQNYFGDSIIGIAFVLSVLYCLLVKTKYKKALILGLIITVVFILNDFSVKLIGVIGETKTYYRFLWIIPVTLVIAYVLTELFDKYKQKPVKAILIACLCFVLVMSGTYCLPYRGILIPANEHNLPNDVIQISRIIEEDYGETDESPAERMTNKRVALPYDLKLRLRSYDGSVSYGISRNAYNYINEHGLYTNKKKYNTEEYVIRAIVCGYQEDVKKLRKCIDKLEIRYLVTSVHFAMDEYFAQIDCYPIGYTGDYVIYKVE